MARRPSLNGTIPGASAPGRSITTADAPSASPRIAQPSTRPSSPPVTRRASPSRNIAARTLPPWTAGTTVGAAPGRHSTSSPATVLIAISPLALMPSAVALAGSVADAVTEPSVAASTCACAPDAITTAPPGVTPHCGSPSGSGMPRPALPASGTNSATAS